MATEGLDTFPYRIDRLAVVLRADHALASVKAREAAPRVAFEGVLDDDLIHHPQLRTRPMDVNGRRAEIPALPYRTEWDDEVFASAPKVGQHC